MVIARRILGLGLGLLIWSLAGCGEQAPEELFAAAETAAADSSTHSLALERFTRFLENHPGHELCDDALRKLAMIARQKGDMEGAIAYYQRLLAEHPASEYGDEAQFMIAFICEEYLKDLERARQAYQRVIDNYPESDLAVSARRLLPFVGRNPEEWVEFQD